MTVQCDEFEFCKVKVHYTADSSLVKNKRGEVLDSFKKMNIKVPGFRQNSSSKNIKKKNKSNSSFKESKAYEIALKNAYKKSIEEKVKTELISEAYDEVLFETKIKPIGYPQINGANLDSDTFECEMVFLKKPEFELKQYKGFEIPEPHQQETATVRAERIIEELRRRNGEIEIYGENDFLQEGDQVTMDVKTICEGEVVTSLTKEGLPYTVGQNSFKEFDHNIYGMKPGESRSFDIQFADNEEINQEIRGKRVNFSVTLHMGTKLVPCALDDAFAEKMGYKNFTELHNEAIGTASAQLDKTKKQMIVAQVINRILKVHDFEVPAWLTLIESQKVFNELGMDMSKASESEIDSVNKQSKNKIKLSLILDSIRDQEPEALFSEEEIIKKMTQNILQNNGNPNEVLSRAQKDGSLFGLVAKLKDEATIQWLIEQSTVINEVIHAQTEETEGSVDSGVSG